jgi:cell fate regulator YaaT (PSP1 superfamily)
LRIFLSTRENSSNNKKKNMGCSSGACSSGSCGKSGGCSGGCASGGCNKLNTFDWLSANHVADPRGYKYVEVSFKNGSRKDFFRLKANSSYQTGDWVAVDTGGGYDVGQISLSGELVLLQIKKKRVKESFITSEIIRLANDRDMEKFQEARSIEKNTMIRARAAARSLGLDMKVGDVEYQCDLRKATFYFTSDSRVDFRELIRIYARDFRVKIEMRQIGARQESAKIGGIGSCGRELCCSTWLTSFKSVNTSAARYQNLSINQAKLSGQCGRLKCCLNYELDTYLEALESFPQQADTLRLVKGKAYLMKTDVFKGLLYYNYQEEGRNVIVALDKETVFELQDDIKKGNYPESLQGVKYVEELEEEALDYDDDGTGEIELPDEKRRRNKRRKKPGKPEAKPQVSVKKATDNFTFESLGNPEVSNASQQQSPRNKQKSRDHRTPGERTSGQRPSAQTAPKPAQNNPNNEGGSVEKENKNQSKGKRRFNRRKNPNNKGGSKPQGDANA